MVLEHERPPGPRYPLHQTFVTTRLQTHDITIMVSSPNFCCGPVCANLFAHVTFDIFKLFPKSKVTTIEDLTTKREKMVLNPPILELVVWFTFIFAKISQEYIPSDGKAIEERKKTLTLRKRILNQSQLHNCDL